jgi:SPP1 family predicted phage head-tail adaptor
MATSDKMNVSNLPYKKTLASEMRHYVDILKKSSADNGEGSIIETWAVQRSQVPAAILPIQANKQFQYMSENVVATHIVKVRGDVEVGEADRIQFGDRIFEVRTVEDIQELGIIKFITCGEQRD